MLNLSIALSAATAACAALPQQPVELGQVAWLRDYDAALERARAEDKPVFALFQEVPGCSTCRNFGGGPLSHPLLVEAIEELFVPLAIYNNRGGDDARVLNRYDEPSWNNPVVRYLDADGKDVLARRDRVWSTGGVAVRTVEALRAADEDVPAWLELAAQEASAGRLATATFAMGCFWQGEARLGALDGVVRTRAGWQGGREVVEVHYDPRRIERDALEQHALRSQCSRASDDGTRAARTSDDKFYLRRTPLNALPLTPMQRTKVNAELGTRGRPERWLSPRQRELHAALQGALTRNPNALAGLVPPSGLEGLGAYERKLRARIDGEGEG